MPKNLCARNLARNGRTILPCVQPLEPRTLFSDVSLDPNFGFQGVVHVDSPLGAGPSRYVGDLLVQDDGKILVAAEQYGYYDPIYKDDVYEYAIERLNTDGTPDATYGDGGVANTWSNRTPEDYSTWMSRMDLLPDGSTLVTATAGSYFYPAEISSSGNITWTTERYPEDYPPAIPSGDAIAMDVARHRIFVAGPTRNSGLSVIDISPQSSGFGHNGLVHATFASLFPRKMAYSVLKETVLDDGSLLVAGRAQPLSPKGYWWVGGPQYFILAKFKPDGSLDSTFGRDGRSVVRATGAPFTDYPPFQYSDGPDGEMIGWMKNVVYRFNSSGLPDKSFNGTGSLKPAGFTQIDQVRVAADGKIVIAGNTSKLGQVLARLNVDGTYDKTFGGGVVARHSDSGTVFSLALEGTDAVVISTWGPNPLVFRYRIGPPIGEVRYNELQPAYFADFNVGGEGVAFHDTDSINTVGKYRKGGVDVAAVDRGDALQYVVTDTHPGEWLDYTIQESSAGPYVLYTILGSAQAGGTIHYEVDGVDVTGPIQVPDTGGTQRWRVVASPVFNLGAGQYLLRLSIDSAPRDGGNVADFLKFTLKPPTDPPPRVPAFVATYYRNASFSGPGISRTDHAIDFNWGNGSPDPLIKSRKFSAVWVGNFVSNVGATDVYTFTAISDGGIQLWVGGRLLIDELAATGKRDYTAKIKLAGYRNYSIRVKYVHTRGTGIVRVNWSSRAFPQYGSGIAAVYAPDPRPPIPLRL
jgi:uncharacterized delta-60 repeat protein